MSRRNLSFRKLLHSVSAGFAVLVIALATVVVGPGAPTANAAGAGCRHYTAQATFPVNDSRGTYYASAITSTPGWSACRNINAESFYGLNGVGSQCASIRVRFFLSDGTSKYYKDFHWVCKNDAAATNVRDGAVYRIEMLAPTKVGIFD